MAGGRLGGRVGRYTNTAMAHVMPSRSLAPLQMAPLLHLLHRLAMSDCSQLHKGTQSFKLCVCVDRGHATSHVYVRADLEHWAAS